MSAYVEDIKDLMDLIGDRRDAALVDRTDALCVGTNIKLSAQAILCVGEKKFRDFLYNKGQEIIIEVGDDEFFTTNPDPDFKLIERIINEVYDRLEFELTSGPMSVSA